MAATMMTGGLAGKLAAVLTAGELAELAGLIGPDEHEHDTCAEVTGQLVAEALARGRSEGWQACMDEIRATDAGIVRNLELELVRWTRLCMGCRRAGRRRLRCQDCRPGPRARFGRPVPGEYRGGPVVGPVENEQRGLPSGKRPVGEQKDAARCYD
jgi:hypothetical protein